VGRSPACILHHYYVEYDRGWNLGGVPWPPLPDARPDAEASVRYEVFPACSSPRTITPTRSPGARSREGTKTR
jgi:hypothetical protein